MRFILLSSGSSGNSLLIEYDDTRILVDCGISCRRLTARLKKKNIAPESLSAICLTHDHHDHISGLNVFLKRYPIPVYATEGTCTGAECRLKNDSITWRVFSPGNTFQIGSLTVVPFSVPHDAGDPVGFVVHNDNRRLGIITDLGFAPAMVVNHLRDCHALVLEANHDVEMLRQSDRPWSLKERILGRHGHLSNDQTAELLGEILPGSLETLVLAHLSEECNTPALAKNRISDELKRRNGHDMVKLHVASPEPTPFFKV